ncbi:hypothetical protein CB1_001111036 [Camelus ferus]|nr:hypothetical protein CB1_001111036 [Camelus ferus]
MGPVPRRGLIASSFTETHYLQDGTDVSLIRNYTGHCYYHGRVQGYPGSTVSVSTCSGLSTHHGYAGSPHPTSHAISAQGSLSPFLFLLPRRYSSVILCEHLWEPICTISKLLWSPP